MSDGWIVEIEHSDVFLGVARTSGKGELTVIGGRGDLHFVGGDCHGACSRNVFLGDALPLLDLLITNVSINREAQGM